MAHQIIKLFIILFGLEICEGKKYDNYSLYRGFPLRSKDLQFFKDLENNYDINFWRSPSKINRTVEFTLPPEQKDQFLNQAAEKEIYVTTIMENIQRAFDQQSVKTYIRRRMETFDWQNYFRYNDIVQWLRDLCRIHPNEVSCISIGKTHEQRDIMAVRVFLKNGPAHRQVVIIEGGIHAREWIAPAFVTYMLNEILNSSNAPDARLRLIGNNYEWFFVPVLNPDGYEYSHSMDRLWRKNRRGPGVDLNRNFGYQFGTVGVSYFPNSEIYCGPKEFSEPESRAMKNFIEEHSQNLDYYFSFHSYGQYIIIPYAHTIEHLDNFPEVKKIGDEAAREMGTFKGEIYVVGTAYDTVGYLVAGASICWAKHTFKVPYVMTFELSDRGTYGFALPAKLILSSCKEAMRGMIYILSPRNTSTDFIEQPYSMNGQENKVFDFIIVICNIVLFIIMRFD